MTAMLSIEDLHTYYGDSYVLQGVTLELKPGQVVALLGRNGVGKTTLVRSIAGLTPAQRGRIVFRDTDITRMPISYRQCVTMFTEEMSWLKGGDLDLVMGGAIVKWLGWQRAGA